MFKNYFIVALRNFQKNKVFSLINILGLSIGISAAVVIFVIVYFELSYDRFEPDHERIYRVVLDAQFGGVPGHSAAVPAPLGGAIRKELTGIEETVPVFGFPGNGSTSVSAGEIKPADNTAFRHQDRILFTTPDYFHLIPYKFMAGSAEHSLQTAFSVVLTESRARQYFPSLPMNEVLGKEIIYNNEIHTSVSGIVADLPENTSFTGKEFISYETVLNTSVKDRLMMSVWNDWMANSALFLKLEKGTTKQAVEQQIKILYEKYNPKNLPNAEGSINLVLQPLADIHFNREYSGLGQRIASYRNLCGLLALAGFLLLLACINFINLSTAQASQRAKEIGIRKTMGSSRTQLIVQFLGETLFITTIATITSVVLVPFLFQSLSDFIPQGLKFNLQHQPVIIIFLILLTLVVSFLAGLYPAMILSAFNPVNTLKNQASKNNGTGRSAWVRKTLTVSQFVVAQFFIIGTIIVVKQIHFSLNRDVGFRKDAIINFDRPQDTSAIRYLTLLNDLRAIPEIELVSSGFFSPASSGVAFTNIKFAGKEDLKEQVQLRWGDSNYIKVYQIQILAGRNIRKTDSFQEFLINEKYATLLGFHRPQDALNKQLNFNGKLLPIVGVMKDFTQLSTHSPIGPLVFAGGLGSTFHVLLKPRTAEGKNWQNAIAKMRKAFDHIYPGADFNYSFVDDNLAGFYKDEKNISQLLLWATALTVFISCLGLLGMVIYVTNTRTKEIGIRKVLGAPVQHIVFLLSNDLIFLVLIAFLIAAPISWWASYQWLSGFAYRTSISWWIFLLCAVVILLFAFITMSIQTLRAAFANPVISLRTE